MIPSSSQMQVRQQHQTSQSQEATQSVPQTVVGSSQNLQPNVAQTAQNTVQPQSHQPVRS